MIIYPLSNKNEFPNSCADCKMCNMNEEMTHGWCANQFELNENDLWYKRNKNCPLIKWESVR